MKINNNEGNEAKWWTRKHKKVTPGSPEYFRERIQSHLLADPSIEGSSRISVSVKKGGLFGKKVIHLIGQLHSSEDRKRAEEIAKKNSGKDMEVVNEIVVEN